MKRFMMFSVSILCLSIAVLIGFYVGSQRAEAQTPEGTVFFTNSYGGYFYYIALLPNGDIYINSGAGGGVAVSGSASYCGNFWSGQVSAAESTWGDVKSRKK
jgi:hypothetical protein